MSERLFNLTLPINATSFGNVSFTLLDGLLKNKVDNFVLFPYGRVDISPYSAVNQENSEFVKFLQLQRADGYARYNSDDLGLTLWHINGSHNKISSRQILFTFHETDEITATERNLLNQQEAIIVSSPFTKQVMVESGVETPIHLESLAFDTTHFYATNKKYHPEDICVFSLVGKYEMRKWTAKTAKAWIKKYGNNGKFQLNLSVYNIHLKPQDNNRLLYEIFEGKDKPFNVNILPFFTTLGEVNELYNSTDIIIDMSGNEGYGLPGAICTGLGKHAIVHHNGGALQWATKDNAVLIQSSGKVPANDGMFFTPNGQFNAGNFWEYNEQDFLDGLDEVYKRWSTNRVNEAGLELQKHDARTFAYDIVDIKNY